MAVVNANTPLVDKTTGNQFYPLTAYNQVIMPDGSRWNGETSGDVDSQIQTLQNTISQLQETINQIISDTTIQLNESLVISGFPGGFSGYVTSSGVRLYVFIPISKTLDISGGIARCELKEFTCKVRQNGKYIIGESNAMTDISHNQISSNVSVLGITLVFAPTWAVTPTNNCEVSVELGKMDITFVKTNEPT